MTDESREPDGFKIAAEQNIISGRFNARTAPKKTPQEQELQKFHRSMMAAACNGVMATFSAMPLAMQKAVVNWHDTDTNSEGNTALITAAQLGRTDMVKHLLSIGADVSLVNDAGFAAIHGAAAAGKVEVLLLLAGARADLHPCSTRGMTPLMVAVDNGKPASVKFFLDRGGDTHAVMPDGRSIKTKARSNGRDDIVELIDACEKNRGVAAAIKMVEGGTEQAITVSRPLRLKNSR
jgi:hypothetical protein